MKAIFFGSIGSLVETSEIQRGAFNSAFEAFGLDWHWDRDTYRQMLAESGGTKRVADYANIRNCDVDASAIHKLKTEIFQERLWNDGFKFRDGVLDVLGFAAERNLATGVISGTEKQTVDLITTALQGRTGADLNIVTSRAEGCAEKPSPDLYHFALNALALKPSSVVAIEDNQCGLDAAKAANIPTVSFSGANTPPIHCGSYDLVVERDLLTSVQALSNYRLSTARPIQTQV
ncbi:MAG: HAD-IA family hydrolase [Pseudomonadota bacterium]